MAYNTGNPVGSTDPRDLYDNAPIFDKYVSGDEPFVTDRLGKQRLSISGQNEDFENSQEGREAAFQQFLADSAFVFIGDYAAGLNFTSRSQYTIRDGVPYRLAPSTTIPYLTTGNWTAEQAKFTPINSDDILRQDLAPANSDVQVGGVPAAELGDLALKIETQADGRIKAAKFTAGTENPAGAATRDAFYVGRNVTGATDCHGFRDNTLMSGVTDAGTYGVFDSTVRLEGSNSQNHIYSFQHRVIYAGSGILGQFAGFLSRPVHAGTGVINETFGADIGNMVISAGGTITQQTGMRVRDQTGASINVGIVVDQVAGYSLFAAGGAPLHNKGRAGFGIVPSTNYALQYAGTAVSARRGFLETTATNFQIGAEGDGVTQFISNSGARLQIKAVGNSYAVTPGADNTQPCGDAANRWSTVWAGSATISTSDAREKTEVRRLTAAELTAASALAREIGAYKFLRSLEDKGDEAREHIGMTVQRAKQVMEEHGLDPYAYSFICYDKWDYSPGDYKKLELGDVVDVDSGEVVHQAVESNMASPTEGQSWQYTHSEEIEISAPVKAGDRYSFRESGLLAFIAAGFEARLAALEAK